MRITCTLSVPIIFSSRVKSTQRQLFMFARCRAKEGTAIIMNIHQFLTYQIFDLSFVFSSHILRSLTYFPLKGMLFVFTNFNGGPFSLSILFFSSIIFIIKILERKFFMMKVMEKKTRPIVVIYSSTDEEIATQINSNEPTHIVRDLQFHISQLYTSHFQFSLFYFICA